MIARSRKQVTAIRLIEKSDFVAEVMSHLDVVDIYVGKDSVKVNDQWVEMGGFYIVEDGTAMDYETFIKNYEIC